MKNLKQAAFTIIELIFVIAIIGVMASIGVSLFQRRCDSEKVHKCALQIQQLLQAAMAYNVDKGHWPTDGGTFKPPLSEDFQPYVPVGETLNPWGIQYSFFSSDNKLFTVVTSTRTVGEAKQLVAILPNATQKPGDPTEIEAQVTVPGQAAPNQVMFGGGGFANNRGSATGYCPSGWTANFYGAFSALTAPKELGSKVPIASGHNSFTPSSCAVASGHNSCTVSVYSETDCVGHCSSGHSSMAYFVVCTKPSNS